MKNEELERVASDYADELIKARTVKDYEKSWIEAVFIHVAKSEAAKKWHEKSEVDIDEIGSLIWPLIPRKCEDNLHATEVVNTIIDSIKPYLIPKQDGQGDDFICNFCRFIEDREGNYDELLKSYKELSKGNLTEEEKYEAYSASFRKEGEGNG